MDASAVSIQDAAINNVINLYLDDIHYFKPPKHNTIIKYTKLPDFDFDSRATWSGNSYTLKPELRRIIRLDDDNLLKTNRSLKNIVPPPKIVAPSKSRPKRVMVTISEENEHDVQPKFSIDKRQYSKKTTNKATEQDFKMKQSQDGFPNSPTSRLSNSPNNPSSRLTNPPKLPKEIKSAKTSRPYYKKELTLAQQSYRGIPPRSAPVEKSKIEIIKEKELTLAQQSYRRIPSRSPPSVEKNKIEIIKEKETLRSSRNLNPTLKTKDIKNIVIPRNKEISKVQNIVNKNNIKNNINNSATCRGPVEKSKQKKITFMPNKVLKEPFQGDNNTSKTKPLTIYVPLNDTTNKDMHVPYVPPVQSVKRTADCASDTNDVVHYKDAVVATDPVPTSISQITNMQDFEINTTCESAIQTDYMDIVFDCLEIPNVTLTKDKSEPKEDPTIFDTTALLNLEVPPVKIVPQTEEVSSSDRGICQSSSIIISQATPQKLSVTYTTRRKFKFQLLGNVDDVEPSLPPSPINYPMNVVSVFRNELKIKNTNENDSSDGSSKKKSTPREDHLNHLKDLKSLDGSYLYNKLMKPSDIISTIRLNNGLLQSDICEQFQRELNFIDSFFESLQYLENFSLTDKPHTENKVENFTNNPVLFESTFDAKNSGYDNFLSKLENGTNIDDTETMASKSLCLLNLLIRDEQRRAKNLLFVLKMREDALKDFTKSQILWLEKKKKHDNTDISTLKKKQRGALLKLQHECGEMQRMRKALLTLSEKRKVALMKTMKNIELKLKNNVDVVEQIILGKKKLKRNTGFDRNAAPLKCFDLSSSGCEENSSAKATSEASLLQAEECTPQCEVVELCGVTSVEKYVQTSTSYCTTDFATDTAAENFVVVDGGYLNILFHNLTLPQIFSSGKQYEVNEEALKNIVNSANSSNNNLSGSEVIEKLMDQIKNKDGDTSSTSPSTARSLIDEFDQYYKDLNEVNKSFPTIPENHESKDSSSQTWDSEFERPVERVTKTSLMSNTASTNSINNSLSNEAEPCVCTAVAPLESEGTIDKEPVTTSQAPTGPLPVPVGAAAVIDSQLPEVATWSLLKSTSSSSEMAGVSSLTPCVSTSATSASPLVSAPAHVEAEELRRQQLAIEREIKALEQQQCRLLVVREIPDKPPPPYTPPTETRTPKPSRTFSPDENLEEIVAKHITNPDGSTSKSTEPYVLFVQDYCQESLERHKQELSDMPWDACNLLPQKPQVDITELSGKTSADLRHVLTSLTPTVVSVSSRRSDHIDDILFTEWWRCEPEWTALHTDEAIVKNQIFDSIFQKILTDTIDEYKKTVPCEIVSRCED